jgi:Fe-S-cluster containining protein
MERTQPAEVACNGCTLCCRSGELILVTEEDGDYPYEVEPVVIGGEPMEMHGQPIMGLKRRPDGSCVYVTDAGCAIHGHAPMTCRVFDCAGLYASTTRAQRRQPFGRGPRLRQGALRPRPRTAPAADRRAGGGQMKLHLDSDNGRPICGDGRVWNVAPLREFAATPVKERCYYCQKRFAKIVWPRPTQPPHLKARHVNGLAVIDCPFCGATHTHGWGSGARSPHCGQLRPAIQYILDCEDP